MEKITDALHKIPVPEGNTQALFNPKLKNRATLAEPLQKPLCRRNKPHRTTTIPDWRGGRLGQGTAR